MRTFKIAGWFAAAYAEDSTHQFTHCAGLATYGSGISVIFSIDRDFHWAMGFAHPQWHLRKGAIFDIAFTVDDMSPITTKALAVGTNQVKVDLDASAELFAQFRRGNALRVAAASQIFSFNLTGTSQLLPALLICAQNRGVAMAANPFEAKPENSAGPKSIQDSNDKAEATAFAANLLSAAGVQGFTLLTPTDFPEVKGDARWVQGSTFGSINVLPNISRDQLKEISAYLIGADAKGCKGTFFSGAIPDDAATELGRVFTTCQPVGGGKAITSYYLAVPRKAGGAYVISTVSFGSEKPAKDADSLLRSAVFKALVN